MTPRQGLARLVPIVALALLAPLAACDDSSKGDGDDDASGGSAASSSPASTGVGGAGGEGGYHPASSSGAGASSPEDAHTPEECVYEGIGGANGYICRSVNIALSEPVAVADLTMKVETDLGDTLTTFCRLDQHECILMNDPTPPVLGVDGDPVTTISLLKDSGGWYTPTWVDVELTQGGQVIADQKLENPTFYCHNYNSDDWCWESNPLQLTVTLP